MKNKKDNFLSELEEYFKNNPIDESEQEDYEIFEEDSNSSVNVYDFIEESLSYKTDELFNLLPNEIKFNNETFYLKIDKQCIQYTNYDGVGNGSSLVTVQIDKTLSKAMLEIYNKIKEFKNL
jgi:RNA binding exosome subunit